MARKYATADDVDRAQLIEFVRPRHRMVLTTFRADGSLQSSPVTGGMDEAGRILISSYPGRAKSATSVATAGPASWCFPTSSTTPTCRSTEPRG